MLPTLTCNLLLRRLGLFAVTAAFRNGLEVDLDAYLLVFDCINAMHTVGGMKPVEEYH